MIKIVLMISTNNKKLVIFIQARFSSTRLPGKVLMKIGNTSILEILINRLKKLSLPIYVLTSDKKEDKKIIELVNSIENCNAIVGELENVRKRFKKAVEETDCNYFFRVTADNHFTSIFLMKELLLTLQKRNYFHDYITFEKKFLIEGIKTELISSESLINDIVSFPDHRFSKEHVSWTISRNAKKKEFLESNIFENLELDIRKNILQKSITIDTKEDFLSVEKYFSSLSSLDKDNLILGNKDIEEIIVNDPQEALFFLASRKDLN